METYLDRIKKLKNEQKLTNDQLAERSGIPLGTLSKILAGMSDSPKLATMIALCGALGCSVEYTLFPYLQRKSGWHRHYLLELQQDEGVFRHWQLSPLPFVQSLA